MYIHIYAYIHIINNRIITCVSRAIVEVAENFAGARLERQTGALRGARWSVMNSIINTLSLSLLVLLLLLFKSYYHEWC